MSEIPKVVVVLARCRCNRQPFGMRFEQKSGIWVVDWAFAIAESAAKREGYDRNLITGDFAVDTKYPGCPSCRVHGWFKCSCGKVGCWDGETRVVTCPWCDATGQLGGSVTSLSSGNDR